MTNKGKGKSPAGKSPAGKRKVTFSDDKTGALKRKNRGVVQFFEEEASDFDSSEDSSDLSGFTDESYEDEFETLSTRNETAKGQTSASFVPKEELVDEEEFDRMMEKRIGCRLFTYAEDEFEDKPMDNNSLHHALKESIPTIWKVKCTNSGDKKDGGSWTSASGGASGSWNNDGSGQVREAKGGAGWAKETDSGAGWSKGTDSGAGWAKGTDSAPDKGQSSSWNESAADGGAAGSWGKKNDGGSKGGW